MTKFVDLPRAVATWAISLLLAVVVGYLLAAEPDFLGPVFVAAILSVILFPLTLRYHHEVLIVSWNAVIVVPFLPGQPSLGVVMAFLTLGIAAIQRTLQKRQQTIWMPQIAWPLLALLAVILLTAMATGGFGTRVLGSESWGGKRYLTSIGAIVGYFALTAQPVPAERAQWLTGLYFLSGTLAVVSDLAFAAGEHFYFLYSFFPADVASLQIITQSTLNRFSGPTWASMAVWFFMVMRYGIRGVLDLRHPWRLAVVLGATIVSLVGGYRSAVIVLVIVSVFQFFFEGLARTRFLPLLLGVAVLAYVGAAAFVDRLPLSAQRALSFLPIEVDPMAKRDALGTLDWRLDMWRIAMKEVPTYLYLGKGYSFSGVDYYLTQESVRRGLARAYEDTLISGNYHHGVLTLIIPFSVFGLAAFGWFCWGALRVLWRHYRLSGPALQNINTFLIAYFSARLLFYLTLYGQFDLDLKIFTGLIGLSVSLNAARVTAEDPQAESAPALPVVPRLPVRT